MRLAATAILASRSTMQGLFPPSSSTTGVRYCEAAFITVLPKDGLPVKKMTSNLCSSSIWFTSRLPWVTAIYFESKVSEIISSITLATVGVYGEGFNRAQQPDEMAPTRGFNNNWKG